MLGRVSDSQTTERFCEDCNYSSTAASRAHTRPPTYGENCYWVSSVDNFSRFPAVYSMDQKLDFFTVFMGYKVWEENVSSRELQILRDDKGRESGSRLVKHFSSKFPASSPILIHDPAKSPTLEPVSEQGTTHSLICQPARSLNRRE